MGFESFLGAQPIHGIILAEVWEAGYPIAPLKRVGKGKVEIALSLQRLADDLDGLLDPFPIDVQVGNHTDFFRIHWNAEHSPA